MKTKMISKLPFFLLLVCVLAYCISCSFTEKSNSAITTGSPISTPHIDSIPEECRVYGGITAYQISDTCAMNSIDEYQGIIKHAKQAIGDQISIIDTSLLVYGAYVELSELKRVLDFADTSPGSSDELYLMLGIIEDKSHLIFALQQDDDSKTITASAEVNPIRNTLFFDFTIPCPSTCPKQLPYIH